jgi:hypothetical protein
MTKECVTVRAIAEYGQPTQSHTSTRDNQHLDPDTSDCNCFNYIST